MRVSELIKRVKKAGWRLLRHGKEHDIWTNGKDEVAISRHHSKEMPTGTARSILKQVEGKIKKK